MLETNRKLFLGWHKAGDDSVLGIEQASSLPIFAKQLLKILAIVLASLASILLCFIFVGICFV